MTEAEKEMNVLDGEPVQIKLCGNELEIKRMSLKKQRQAIQCFSRAGESKGNEANASDITIDIMVAIISVASGIPKESIEEQSNIGEITVAFEKIWNQNGFSFLLKTMAKVGETVGGITDSKTQNR